jgi:hypothetical protein
MKPSLAGGSGRVWKWLIAGALAFGFAPAQARAQGPMRYAAPARGQGNTPPLEMPRLAGAALFGLPTKGGRVQWPFGLEGLTPSDEAQALRDQLELVLDVIAAQAAEGQVNRVLIGFGLGSVRDLRQMLKQEQGGMSPKTYAEAIRFLDRTERGLNRLKTGENGPAIQTTEPRPGAARP